MSTALLTRFSIGLALALGLAAGFARHAPAAERITPFFTSPSATEARLKFDHEVEFQNKDTPDANRLEEIIGKQLVYSMGSMRGLGVMPKLDHEIKVLKVKRKRLFSDTWTARYHYEGTVIVSKNWTAPILEFILPINPETIYRDAIVVKRGPGPREEETFPCTDPHYTSSDDFWYFWNPSRPGCLLKENVHFRKVSATYTRLENTAGTKPEYGRLPVATEAGPELRIRLLIGMNGAAGPQSPFGSEDGNAPFYLEIRKQLLDLGFDVRLLAEEPLEEEFTLSTPKGLVRITSYFGNTGLYQVSTNFHRSLKDGLEKDSVVIYNGHSGLGDSLNLKYIESYEGYTIQPAPDRYQLYFFNGCATYSYYLTPFFDRKITEADPLGHHNLDIISEARSVGPDTFPDSTMKVIGAVLAWATDGRETTYTELLTAIDHGSIPGVTGDEDNR